MAARIVAEETAAGREQARGPRPRTGSVAPAVGANDDAPDERALEAGRMPETGRVAGDGFGPMILARGAI
jgi:hypothetical protein